MHAVKVVNIIGAVAVGAAVAGFCAVNAPTVIESVQETVPASPVQPPAPYFSDQYVNAEIWSFEHPLRQAVWTQEDNRVRAQWDAHLRAAYIVPMCKAGVSGWPVTKHYMSASDLRSTCLSWHVPVGK